MLAYGEHRIVGIFCNSKEDVLELARGGTVTTNPFSYFNIGKLFATKTKEGRNV